MTLKNYLPHTHYFLPYHTILSLTLHKQLNHTQEEESRFDIIMNDEVGWNRKAPAESGEQQQQQQQVREPAKSQTTTSETSSNHNHNTDQDPSSFHSTDSNIMDNNEINSTTISSVHSLLSVPLELILRGAPKRPLLTRAEAQTLFQIAQLAQELDILLVELLPEQVLKPHQLCRRLLIEQLASTSPTTTSTKQQQRPQQPYWNALRVLLSLLQHEHAIATHRKFEPEIQRILGTLWNCAATLRQSSEQNWTLSESLFDLNLQGGGGSTQFMAQEKQALSQVEEEVATRIEGLLTVASMNHHSHVEGEEDGGTGSSSQQHSSGEEATTATSTMEPMPEFCARLFPQEANSATSGKTASAGNNSTHQSPSPMDTEQHSSSSKNSKNSNENRGPSNSSSSSPPASAAVAMTHLQQQQAAQQRTNNSATTSSTTTSSEDSNNNSQGKKSQSTSNSTSTGTSSSSSSSSSSTSQSQSASLSASNHKASVASSSTSSSPPAKKLRRTPLQQVDANSSSSQDDAVTTAATQYHPQDNDNNSEKNSQDLNHNNLSQHSASSAAAGAQALTAIMGQGE